MAKKFQISPSNYVPGFGPLPSDVMLVGQNPGKQEYKAKKPFVGLSGQDLEWYFKRNGLTFKNWYVTNVVKHFKVHNIPPTIEEVNYWAMELLDEVAACEPKLIVTIGALASEFFLGPCTMEMVHGIPHLPGQFDARKKGYANCVIVPAYHPALGLHVEKMKSIIAKDYDAVCDIYRKLKAGKTIDLGVDEFRGIEDYRDCTGNELVEELETTLPSLIALDTEGSQSDPWSIQVCWKPGQAFTLRYSKPDFDLGIDCLQYLVDSGECVFLMHNAMHDLGVCRAMGLDMRRCKIIDTQYAAYLLCTEPQGLKPLSYRHCGMKMQSFLDLIAPSTKLMRIKYLNDVVGYNWPRPLTEIRTDKNGRKRKYTPQSIEKKIGRILNDIYNDKRNKNDEPVDIEKRFYNVAESFDIEKVFGPLPKATIADIDLDKAIFYASRDPDATLRAWKEIEPKLDELDQLKLFANGMKSIVSFEQMQTTGLPCSKSHFDSFQEQLLIEMKDLQDEIEIKYNYGEKFNPASPKQVAELMNRLGIKGLKYTKTGQISTDKQSIEYLRKSHESIDLIFQWRERQHLRNSFCLPLLKRINAIDLQPPVKSSIVIGDSSKYPDPNNHFKITNDLYRLTCQILPTRTETRRLATKHPNLLALPSRSELGKQIRKGFIAPKGMLFGSWDLSQIEARFMAHESGDELMIQLFCEDRDMHTETASRIFEVDLDKVTDMQRFVGKTINFGTMYGIQAKALSRQLMMRDIVYSKAKSENALRMWAKTYIGVTRYRAQVIKETIETGMSRDHWGKIRYLPEIWSREEHKRAEAGRQAVSHRIQGGAQGMIQNSMNWIADKINLLVDDGAQIYMCLQIHDELIFLFEEDLSEMLDSLVVEGLTAHSGIDLAVPIKASGNVADNWGDLK